MTLGPGTDLLLACVIGPYHDICATSWAPLSPGIKGKGDRRHSDWNVGKSLSIPPLFVATLVCGWGRDKAFCGGKLVAVSRQCVLVGALASVEGGA